MLVHIYLIVCRMKIVEKIQHNSKSFFTSFSLSLCVLPFIQNETKEKKERHHPQRKENRDIVKQYFFVLCFIVHYDVALSLYLFASYSLFRMKRKRKRSDISNESNRINACIYLSVIVCGTKTVVKIRTLREPPSLPFSPLSSLLSFFSFPFSLYLPFPYLSLSYTPFLPSLYICTRVYRNKHFLELTYETNL